MREILIIRQQKERFTGNKIHYNGLKYSRYFYIKINKTHTDWFIFLYFNDDYCIFLKILVFYYCI